MANLITDFRQALSADLAIQFPAAEIVQGERTGRSVDKDRIAVFWAASSEQSGRVHVGEANIVVRYWPQTAKVRDEAALGVRDPGDLEQAAWDLQTFLQTKQTAYSASGTWFCRLMSVEPDYDPDEWGVQAIITLQFNNPATIP